MAFPLLQLLGLGAGMFGGQALANMQQQGVQDQQMQAFTDLTKGQQEGLDLGTTEGLGLYGGRMATDARTARGGLNMLNQAAAQRQQQQQFDTTFNSLSAYQQAMMQQQQQENAAAAMQQGMEANQARVGAFMKNYQENIAQPFLAEKTAMQGVVDLFDKPKVTNAEAYAGLQKLNQSLQGGRFARPGETDPGLSQGIEAMLGSLEKLAGESGLGDKERADVVSTIETLYANATKSAQSQQEIIKGTAQANPALGLPGFDPTPYLRDDLLFAPLKRTVRNNPSAEVRARARPLTPEELAARGLK